MVIIDRDHTYGRGDLFTIKLSEPGFGVQAMRYHRATLKEAQAAVAHYYEPADATHIPTECVICRELATKRAKTERKSRKGAA